MSKLNIKFWSSVFIIDLVALALLVQITNILFRDQGGFFQTLTSIHPLQTASIFIGFFCVTTGMLYAIKKE